MVQHKLEEVISKELTENLTFAQRIKRLENSIGQKYNPSDLIYHQKKSKFTEDYSAVLDILRNCAKFFDLAEIVKLLLLSKAINKDLFDNELMGYICCLKLRYLSIEKLRPDNVIEKFEEIVGMKDIRNMKHLFEILKGLSNLIKNPCGDQEFEFWKVEHGGDGVGFENKYTYKDKKQVFVTSHEWGTLNQKVTVPAGSKKLIVLGAIASRRIDCGAEIEIIAHINEDELKIHQVLKEGPANYECYDWERFCLVKEAGPEEVLVNMLYKGKDVRCWAGTYGCRFGYFFLYAFPLK